MHQIQRIVRGNILHRVFLLSVSQSLDESNNVNFLHVSQWSERYSKGNREFRVLFADVCHKTLRNCPVTWTLIFLFRSLLYIFIFVLSAQLYTGTMSIESFYLIDVQILEEERAFETCPLEIFRRRSTGEKLITFLQRFHKVNFPWTFSLCITTERKRFYSKFST